MWFLRIFYSARTVTFDFIAIVHCISMTLKAFDEIRSVLFGCRALHCIVVIDIWFWNWSSTRLQFGYNLACHGLHYYYNDECPTPKPVQLHIYGRCALRVRKSIKHGREMYKKNWVNDTPWWHLACTCWVTDKFIAECMANFSFDECRNFFSIENCYQLARLLSFSSGQTGQRLFKETVRCNDQFVAMCRSRVLALMMFNQFYCKRASKWPSNIHRVRGELISGMRKHVYRQSMCSAIDKHKSRELVRLHLLHSIEQI